MKEVNTQLKEYNQFFREFCEAYFNGVHLDREPEFVMWAMSRISKLVAKYEVFGKTPKANA